jgi:hypothetical protein
MSQPDFESKETPHHVSKLFAATKAGKARSTHAGALSL